jgi:hypothetical protein
MFIVLWVRSYKWMDRFTLLPLSGSPIYVETVVGRIGMGIAQSEPNGHNQLYEMTHYLITNPDRKIVNAAAIDQRLWGIAGFGLIRSSNAVVAPIWFAALLPGAIAIIHWAQVPARFSLRTLLIATTVVAVALGMIAIFSR